jgi:hypothetical protein
MVEGALGTMQSPDFTPDAVPDLVPVRPIAAGEEVIQEIYRMNLTGLCTSILFETGTYIWRCSLHYFK